MKKRNSNPKVVVASKENELNRKLVLSSYVCKGCGEAQVSNSGIEPFCASCGSGDMKPVATAKANKGSTAFLKTPESQLSSIMCSSKDCGAVNIITDQLALATTKGELHCICCGTQTPYTTRLISSADEDDSEEDFEDEEEQELDPANLEDPLDNLFDDEEEETEETSASDDSDDSEDDGEADDESADDESEEEMEDEGSADEEVLDEEVEILSAVNQSADCSLLITSSKAYAMLDEQVVASLVIAGDQNEDLILNHTDKYEKAFARAIQSEGIKKALSSFNFKLKKIKVSASLITSNEVKAQLSEELSKVADDAAKDKARFKQAISIAAAGLNKGFFKSKNHAVKVALFEELETAGVRNPAKLIDRVFSSANDEYVGALIELAYGLADKTDESRNQLAEAIGDANYQLAEVEVDDEDLEDEADDMEDTESVVARLSAPVKATVQASTQPRRPLFSVHG